MVPNSSIIVSISSGEASPRESQIAFMLSLIHIFINGAHAYIKLGQYEKAIVWLQQLDEWIPNLEAYARDDIEILKNDILAKAEIHNEQFEKAEEYLENAAALLENDDEEFSSKKDVYVNLTYAELYMAQTRYEAVSYTHLEFYETLSNIGKLNVQLE